MYTLDEGLLAHKKLNAAMHLKLHTHHAAKMSRTKQTARKSTGGIAPPLPLAVAPVREEHESSDEEEFDIDDVVDQAEEALDEAKQAERAAKNAKAQAKQALDTAKQALSNAKRALAKAKRALSLAKRAKRT